MSTQPQSFENHTRIVPVFHFFVFPVLFVSFLWSAYGLYREPSIGTAVSLLVAAALLVLAFCARVFALTVQDRVIRLEMRLRLAQCLPPDLRARIAEFTVPQLVGLRFASDAELPELAARVLRDKLEDRKAIKKMVKDWQADYQRV